MLADSTLACPCLSILHSTTVAWGGNYSGVTCQPLLSTPRDSRDSLQLQQLHRGTFQTVITTIGPVCALNYGHAPILNYTTLLNKEEGAGPDSVEPPNPTRNVRLLCQLNAAAEQLSNASWDALYSVPSYRLPTAGQSTAPGVQCTRGTTQSDVQEQLKRNHVMICMLRIE